MKIREIGESPQARRRDGLGVPTVGHALAERRVGPDRLRGGSPDPRAGGGFRKRRYGERRSTPYFEPDTFGASP